MSETVIVAFITTIIVGPLSAAVMAYLNRRKEAVDVRKADAETDAMESATRQSEVAYYQKRVEDNIAQMGLLETKVADLKAYIGDIQRKYEQRVGELHNKIDSLLSELGRANLALDIANKTIGELRQEVKDGNAIITELRKEITQLLVEQAAKKKDGD